MRSLKIHQFKGLTNVVNPESMYLSNKDGTFAFLQKATNVDIDDQLRILRRPGSTSLRAGAVHSLWSDGTICLFRQGDSLYRLSPTFEATELRSDITGNRRMAYLSINGVVYYSDGVITGAVEDGRSRTWGIVPPRLDYVEAGYGDLKPALYMVCLTYQRLDGQESGPSRINFIQTTVSNGGIIIPVTASSDPDVEYINVYCSTADGMILYRVMQLPNVSTTATIYDYQMIRRGTLQLITEGLDIPPPGTVLEHYNGSVFVAQHNTVWRSKPYAFELFDYRDYHLFPDEVRVMGAVADGMYVGTSRQIIFCQGDNPEKWHQRVVADYGAVKGTLIHVDLGAVGPETTETGDGVMFMSSNGVCLGSPGGHFRNLTEKMFRVDMFPDEGASILRSRPSSNTHFVVLGKVSAQMTGQIDLPGFDPEGTWQMNVAALSLPSLTVAGR